MRLRSVALTVLAAASSLACCAPRQEPAHPAAPSEPAHCEPLAGADALLARAHVVLLGEMHGTAEFPAFVSRLACHAELQGPVIVALELPHTMQPALDAFAEDPSASHAQALFGTEMWTKEYQDGRTSQAMRQLIEALAARAARGAKVRLIAIDDPTQPQARDKNMALNIERAYRQAPEARMIVLTGNVHNRLTVGVPWDPEYRPMGHELREAGVPVTSLHGTYGEGSAWYCETGEASSCGVKPLESDEPARAMSISLDAPCPQGACDGEFHVGKPSASPPARVGAS